MTKVDIRHLFLVGLVVPIKRNYYGPELEALAKRDNVKPGTLKGMLNRMVTAGELERPEHGRYSRAPDV